MILPQLQNNVMSLHAALRTYVTARNEAALTDVSAAVEVLAQEIYQITDGLKLTQKNQIKVNYPAIDLADDNQRTALQITSRLTAAKCKHAIRVFNKNNLQVRYDKLYVVGFCESTVSNPAAKKLPPYVTVEGPSALTVPVARMTVEQLTHLEAVLRRSYDFSQLHPLKDEDCIRIVLTVADRDAIRHHTSVEGSYDDLVDGLKEIRTIITEGRVEKGMKKIYAKPLSSYSQTYSEHLHAIDTQVGLMIGLVNASRSGSVYYLNHDAKAAIDAAKGLVRSSLDRLYQLIWSNRRMREVKASHA